MPIAPQTSANDRRHRNRAAAAIGSMSGLNDLIPLMVELLWALIVVVVVLSIAAVIVGCAS